MAEGVRWFPTHAHLRAVVLAGTCVLIALLARRADAVVLAVPFVAAATWGAHHRPRRPPSVALRLADAIVFEGQVTTTTVTLEAGPGGDIGDVVAACLDAGPAVGWRPPSAAVAVACDGRRGVVPIATRAVRWGRHPISLTAAAATSRLGAYRTEGLADDPVVLTTLPLSAEFDAADVVPRPAGLVGSHRANRQGSGREPAEVRPFRPGDRLRRINWRVSSRTGELHVTSTWADRDTHVLLLLDTAADIGRSDGVDGAASSLDIAVRAAAAIADHFLRAGDRVGLVDLGRRVREVPVGSGRRHLRRLLEALVVAEPGGDHRDAMPPVRPTTAGALVVALSPLVGRTAPTQIARMALHGHTVVVVDTLPPDVDPPSASLAGLAARVRAMERAVEIDQLGELGVPVVQWRGRGTLDEVLRRRQPARPRPARPTMTATSGALRATIAQLGSVPIVLRGIVLASSTVGRADHRPAVLGRPRRLRVRRRAGRRWWRPCCPTRAAGCSSPPPSSSAGSPAPTTPWSARRSSSPRWPCSPATSPPPWPPPCQPQRRPRSDSSPAGGGRPLVIALAVVATAVGVRLLAAWDPPGSIVVVVAALGVAAARRCWRWSAVGDDEPSP